MSWRAALPIVLVLAFLCPLAPVAGREPRSFEERVKAQEAVERVFYNHRAWPTVNGGSKPPFEQVMTREALEAKVRRYLAASEALDRYWQRPITAGQLQAEMDRLARDTRDPQVLRELYAALGNDPEMVAECLARPLLADRLARSWYASDERFHGALKARAEALGQTLTAGTFEASPEGDYARVDLAPDGGPAAHGRRLPGALSREDFEKETRSFPREAGAISLEETRGAFVLKLTIHRTTDKFEGATRTLAKVPFEEWLSRAVPNPEASLPAARPGEAYRLESGGVSGAFKPDTWATGSYVPSPRALHTAVWTGAEMLVWGGHSHAGTPYRTGGRYSPALDAWTPTSIRNAPSPRGAHVAVWTGTEMVVWGGWDAWISDLVDGGRYDPATDTWRPTSTVQAPPGSRYATAVWTGERMIVWGGARMEGGERHYESTGASYNPTSGTWAPLPAANAPEGRWGHTAVWTGAEMIVWGGYNGSTLASGGSYSLVNDSWSPLPVSGVSGGRDFHVAVCTGREMVVWGGGEMEGLFLANGDRFDLFTRNWSPVSPEGAPPGAVGCSAVWTGEEMIVWGGANPDLNSKVNEGARYNPGSDSWRPVTYINAPEPRAYHGAAWTGGEMIVWGGATEDFDASDSGGRYSPTLDQWVPTRTGDAPCPIHTGPGIWTGAEMIVWQNLTQDNDIYIPSLDAWSRTSNAGDPIGRSWNQVAWTGREMIVWGGQSWAGYTKTGGRYNPTTDTWRPTATAGAPDARLFGSAVWTGTEMVIWGGRRSGVYRNDGGRYDPSTDTWRPTSTAAPCPSGRLWHACVFTGSEMIVWGGVYVDGGGAWHFYQDGGRYDPVTDTWAATSITPETPSPRNWPVALFAQGAMVIWSGSTLEEVFNDGARYYPGTDTWVPMAPPPSSLQSGRDWGAGAWTGQEALVWGGTITLPSGALDFPQGGGRYAFAADRGSDGGSWTPTGSEGEPYGRQEPVEIWTGNTLLVWAGDPDGGMGIYAPNTAPTSAPAILNPGGTLVLGEGEPLRLGSTLPTAWLDDVEKPDPQPWEPEGQWHRVLGQDCSGGRDYTSAFHAWYCGDSASCTYGADGALQASTLTLKTTEARPLTRDGLLQFRYLMDLDRDPAPHHFAPSDTPMDIPDGGSCASVIQVGEDSPILDLNVEVTITHPADGELAISLYTPGGLTIPLCTHVGGTGANFSGTVFDDEAGTYIGDASAPFTGAFYSEGYLNDVSGSSTRGVWSLRVGDDAPGNSGRIESWRLIFTVASINADRATVEVSSGGDTWVPVAQDRENRPARSPVMALDSQGRDWHLAEIPVGQILAIPEGQALPVRVRFTFERDGQGDDGLGWLLDDIGIGEPAGDGSNPTRTFTCSNGSTSVNPVPYHDAWDRASFEWDTNGDGLPENPDKTTPLWSVPEGDLRLYGLGTPGDHTLTLRVTDSLELSDSRQVTLHVEDGEPPAVSLSAPAGGESWEYSAATGPRKQHLIVWTASDAYGIGRAKLSYTTDGTTWTCIADSKTPGGDCESQGLVATATSFLWTMPTQAEAAAAGQTFPSSLARVRVEVWDISGNSAQASSMSTFYIIQPSAAATESLILMHKGRTEALYPGEGESLWRKLSELAANDRVNGAVLDLENVSGLQALYDAWDAAPTDPSKANAVVGAVRAYVKGQVASTYTNTKYLVLAGDDRIIPFYRVPDGTQTYPEDRYRSQVDCASTVGSAVCQNLTLTDNLYGDLRDAPDTTMAGTLAIYLPSLGVGRLVETPGEMAETVDTFIAQNGQVTLSRALVTGYDFVSDCAATIRDRFGTSRTDSLIAPPAWTPAQFEGILFSSPPHEVNSVNGHASHHSLGTPWNSVTTEEMDEDHPGQPLRGAVLYGPGCHAGLNIPDEASEPDPLDLPQLLLRKGLAAHIGNTGYGWGLRQGVGYGERLADEITRQLLLQPSIAIGTALTRAKREYFLANRRYDVFDEKTLYESVLYGLPMYQVIAGAAQAPPPSENVGLSASGPDFQAADGIAVAKSLRAVGRGESLPAYITELALNFTFGAETYEKTVIDDGRFYYKLNGKINGEIGDPLQPMFDYDSRLSGTIAHGVVFLGGRFMSDADYAPVVGAPASSESNPGEGPLAPGMSSLIGTIGVSQVQGGAARGVIEAPLTRLSVTTGFYDAERGTESRFEQMSFLVYYNGQSSPTPDTTPPTITDPGPTGTLHTMSGSTARFSVPVTDSAGVYRAWIVYSDLAGEWEALDLSKGTGDHWEGNLQLSGPIAYFAQAVDKAGNVRVLSETGDDVDGTGAETGTEYTVPRMFEASAALYCRASSDAIAGEAPLTVHFSGSASSGVAPYAYTWDFGDGETASGAEVSHTFALAGDYTVTMTVTDSASHSATASLSISVTTLCVLACAAAAPAQGTAGAALSFQASVTTSECSGTLDYSWDFGDGASSSLKNPTHAYAQAGSYTWTLTVVSSGQKCARSGTVAISPPVLPGDCDGDGSVSIGEVQKAINMFLGTQAPGCGADCSGDGTVSIGEVQKVVNAFLGLAVSC